MRTTPVGDRTTDPEGVLASVSVHDLAASLGARIAARLYSISPMCGSRGARDRADSRIHASSCRATSSPGRRSGAFGGAEHHPVLQIGSVPRQWPGS
jgi:hypothetical protein